MLRRFSLGILASLLLPAVALAGSVREKRHVVYHWSGYGFLPGYHQPPSPGEVHYGAPSYLYGGGRYYFGEPGFSHGRWNGGSYGPCWTHTPIGLMWNCG
jgi:hypothetical protein